MSSNRHTAQARASRVSGDAYFEPCNSSQKLVFLCAREQVVVVSHRTVAMDLDGESLRDLAQDRDESCRFPGRRKKDGAVQATVRYVVPTAGSNDRKRAGQRCSRFWGSIGTGDENGAAKLRQEEGLRAGVGLPIGYPWGQVSHCNITSVRYLSIHIGRERSAWTPRIQCCNGRPDPSDPEHPGQRVRDGESVECRDQARLVVFDQAVGE